MKHLLINELLARINTNFLSRFCSKRYIFLMLGCAILVASIFLPLQVLSTSIDDIQNPRESKQWVIDKGNIWDQETEKQLEKSLSALNLKNGTEFAIVTVPDIITSTDLRTKARTLRQSFGIGQPELDNGLLLLIAKESDNLVGFVSKGSGIPTAYFYSGYINGDDRVQAIPQWLPVIIGNLSEVSYQSKPSFKQIYQVAGWVGVGLFIVSFAGIEYGIRSIESDKYLSIRKIKISRASISLTALGKILGSISLSTFILSKSPISGGLNTGNSDFLWVILACFSMLPVHIIPDCWLRYRTKKVNCLSTNQDLYHRLRLFTSRSIVMISGSWAIFRQTAYSDFYSNYGLSDVGTSPILEYSVISLCFFGSLILLQGTDASQKI